MNTKENIRYTRYIAGAFIILVFIRYLTQTLLPEGPILPKETKLIQYLVLVSLHIWPHILTIVLVPLVRIVKKPENYFTDINFRKLLLWGYLSFIIIPFSIGGSALLSFRVWLQPDLQLVKLRFANCVVKMPKSDCKTITLTQCILRETNYRETLSSNERRAMKVAFEMELQEIFRTKCPDDYAALY